MFGLAVRGVAGAAGGLSKFSGEGSGIDRRLFKPSLLNSALPPGGCKVADGTADESPSDGSSLVGGESADSVVMGRDSGSGSALKYCSPDGESNEAATNSSGSVCFRLEASNA